MGFLGFKGLRFGGFGFLEFIGFVVQGGHRGGIYRSRVEAGLGSFEAYSF